MPAARKTKASRGTQAFEAALAARSAGKCILRLYIAGATDRSRQAVQRARQMCALEFGTNFDLKVIDVYQQPILARDGQIIATPTLVREFPKPVRRLIGNLSNAKALFVGLELDTKNGITL
jgi:circadian clock protein KaiB